VLQITYYSKINVFKNVPLVFTEINNTAIHVTRLVQIAQDLAQLNAQDVKFLYFSRVPNVYKIVLMVL